MGFLEHYGYLAKARVRHGGPTFHSEASIKQAIRDFQTFTGLPVTGEISEETVSKMKLPRCGVPDILRDPRNLSLASGSGLSLPQNFHTLGSRWGRNTVTWRLARLSDKLPEAVQRRALERGLRYWSDVAPLTFRHQATGQADIDVEFARGNHGDGYHNRFNGPGGVLAHAFPPGTGLGGDTHFDEDEDWTVGTGQGTDLKIVAAHEFGHALGLGHSTVPGSLMAPYYSYTPKLELHRDDIQGIQSLYGIRRQSTTTTTTRATPSTTTTTSTTTTAEESTPETRTTTIPPTLPPYCRPDFRVDAITDSFREGESLIFRHDKVYRVWQPEPYESVPEYPHYLISQLFSGGPRRHVGAAVYLKESATHYLFKGHRVWKFHYHRLVQGYPKTWLTYNDFLRIQSKRPTLNLGSTYQDYFRFRPSAALTFSYDATNTKIFMFGDGLFWEWDRETEGIRAGYPLDTATYWRGAPRHPDAATSNLRNNFYFFKGHRFYKLHNRVSVGEPTLTSSYWFGNSCNATYFRNQQIKDDKPLNNIITDNSDQPLDSMDRQLFDDTSNISPGVEESFSRKFHEVGYLSAAKPVVSSDEVLRENMAALPFQFDLGPVATGHESERYVKDN